LRDRDGSTANNVANLPTTVHNHALLPFWRQAVSWMFTAAEASTWDDETV